LERQVHKGLEEGLLEKRNCEKEKYRSMWEGVPRRRGSRHRKKDILRMRGMARGREREKEALASRKTINKRNRNKPLERGRKAL